MLIKLMIYFQDLVIGKLPPERRERAKALAVELVGVIAEKGAEGAVRGATK